MANYDFDYLIEKMESQDFELNPFKHIYIEDFFSNEHFDEIISSAEISAPVAKDDKQLIDGLLEKGFKPIQFPGCVTNVSKYINWHQNNGKVSHHTTCEGSGMAFRLFQFPSKILQELNEFLVSEKFNSAIAKKFGVTFQDCVIDGGIQKYLDGYEISPHPDTRKKAATFMVNINQSASSEEANYHTHYLKLKRSYAYVKEFWRGNENIDRAWVPWHWADTVKQQTKNNSIVLFSPANDTLHGVKASYNHLDTQRTQLYGNLWYKESNVEKVLEWNELDLLERTSIRKVTTKQKVTKLLPSGVKRLLKSLLNKVEVGKRNR
jgi:hypothetical protein